jgi:hypothetical protein
MYSYTDHYNFNRWSLPVIPISLTPPLDKIFDKEYLQALSDNEADAIELFERINIVFGKDMSDHWYF